MNGQYRRKIFALLSTLFLLTSQAAAGEASRVVNGRVKEVGLETNELILSYRHPVSGQWEELVLNVDNQTGFGEGVRLQDLRGSDPVSAEYQEDPSGLARAISIRKVPLTGVPLDEKALKKLPH